MRTLALLFIACSICAAQQPTSNVRVLTTQGAVYIKIPDAWLSADSLQVAGAPAVVDSSVWTKLWKFNLLNAVVSLITADTTGWTNSQTLTSSLVFDTLAFTTSATRTAKKITGVLPTSTFIATPRKQADALPVAGDLLSVRCKTDSVIVFRAAGTTSGLQVTIIGKK